MPVRRLAFALAVCPAMVMASHAWAWQAAHNGPGGPMPGAVAPQAVSPLLITGNVLNPELEFVPVTPCRAFDTHATSPLAAARSFTISGAGNLKGQGGAKGGCGVPLWATAVAISLTAASDSGSGSIAAYPAGTPATSTAAVSFNTAGPQTAGVAVAIRNHQLTLKPTGGSAEVIGDVTGYYAPQMAAVIEYDGTIYGSSGRLVSVTHAATGIYYVQFDRAISACSIIVSMDGGSYYDSAYSSGDTAVVQTWTLNGSGGITNTDLWFNIAVHC